MKIDALGENGAAAFVLQWQTDSFHQVLPVGDPAFNPIIATGSAKAS